MEISSAAPENPYAKYVREQELNSTEMPGWSGEGRHVMYDRREDIPLIADEVLGSGAYSVVQKVTHRTNDGPPLAQKIIKNPKNDLNKIMTEVKHMQQLRHRHLVQLVGTYWLDWKLFILLFPVGQSNLREFMEETQSRRANCGAYFECESLRSFFKCLTSAVVHLHTETTPRIKHLDIKPENIIVRRYTDDKLAVFLTDFGVSRSFPPTVTSQEVDTVFTTPVYAAPEITKRSSFGRPADIFALGCVFSEMISVLSGRTLQEYVDYRRSQRGDGSTTIAFANNPDACKSWLQRLALGEPFQLLLVNGPSSWRQTINLIGRMLSVEPSFRLTGQEIVSNFPPGVCCEAPLEVYENSSDPPIQHNVELDMARSLGIRDRQAPSPKHVPGPTITVERIVVTVPMPEALDESTPLPGRPHRTTPRWSDHLIARWPSHLAIPRLSNHRTTSRSSNNLESLSRAEKGMHSNSNSNSDLDSDTPSAIMKIFAITMMVLCVAIVVWPCIKSLLYQS